MEINLTIDPDLVRKILKEFIRSEITRAGFSRAVINLSGGIDSAVSYALSVEAMGA
jgi:NAD+ synthase